jgi:hypothetical protein
MKIIEKDDLPMSGKVYGKGRALVWIFHIRQGEPILPLRLRLHRNISA